jgi:hypothetical protein
VVLTTSGRDGEWCCCVDGSLYRKMFVPLVNAFPLLSFTLKPLSFKITAPSLGMGRLLTMVFAVAVPLMYKLTVTKTAY